MVGFLLLFLGFGGKRTERSVFHGRFVIRSVSHLARTADDSFPKIHFVSFPPSAFRSAFLAFSNGSALVEKPFRYQGFERSEFAHPFSVIQRDRTVADIQGRIPFTQVFPRFLVRHLVFDGDFSPVEFAYQYFRHVRTLEFRNDFVSLTETVFPETHFVQFVGDFRIAELSRGVQFETFHHGFVHAVSGVYFDFLPTPVRGADVSDGNPSSYFSLVVESLVEMDYAVGRFFQAVEHRIGHDFHQCPLSREFRTIEVFLCRVHFDNVVHHELLELVSFGKVPRQPRNRIDVDPVDSFAFAENVSSSYFFHHFRELGALSCDETRLVVLEDVNDFESAFPAFRSHEFDLRVYRNRIQLVFLTAPSRVDEDFFRVLGHCGRGLWNRRLITVSES